MGQIACARTALARTRPRHRRRCRRHHQRPGPCTWCRIFNDAMAKVPHHPHRECICVCVCVFHSRPTRMRQPHTTPSARAPRTIMSKYSRMCVHNRDAALRPVLRISVACLLTRWRACVCASPPPERDTRPCASAAANANAPWCTDVLNMCVTSNPVHSARIQAAAVMLTSRASRGRRGYLGRMITK